MSREARDTAGEAPALPGLPTSVPNCLTSNQLVQAGNFQLQVEALEAGEAEFNITGEQLGIFARELLRRKRRRWCE